jgi:copper chaperone
MSQPTIELTLPDMTCGHCVKSVKATVQKLDPKAQVVCDLPSHKVRIESSVPQTRLEQALAIEGYPAKS